MTCVCPSAVFQPKKRSPPQWGGLGSRKGWRRPVRDQVYLDSLPGFPEALGMEGRASWPGALLGSGRARMYKCGEDPSFKGLSG